MTRYGILRPEPVVCNDTITFALPLWMRERYRLAATCIEVGNMNTQRQSEIERMEK